MIVVCADCRRVYDDAKQWTICPHTPLGYDVYDLCPRCDTLKSVHGPCPHQLEQMAAIRPQIDFEPDEEECGDHVILNAVMILAVLAMFAMVIFFV